jgi:hypothetical protein
MEMILEHGASIVLERKQLPPDLLSSMPQEVLMTVMNRKLASHSWPEPERCTVPVDNIPVGFWRDREFALKWVKCYGRMPDVAGSMYKADADFCLAYYKATDFAVTTLKVPPSAFGDCIAWFSGSLMTDKAFVTECALINPLILNDCSAGIRMDVDFLIDLACQLAHTDENKTGVALERLAETALRAGWGEALIKLVKGLRAKVVDRKAFQSFLVVVGGCELFSSMDIQESTNIMELIDSYVGVVRQERLHDILRVWEEPFIKNHLANAESVEDLVNLSRSTVWYKTFCMNLPEGLEQQSKSLEGRFGNRIVGTQ